MDALDVITVGEAMVLFAAQEEGSLSSVAHFARHAAGAELNVAIGLARLGHRVGYLSRLGQDAFGDYLLQVMVADGVDRRFIKTSPGLPTGFMLKTRAAKGKDPQVEYHRKGSAASQMTADDLPPDWYQARLLHVTGISPALSTGCHQLVQAMLDKARQDMVTVTFDPNLRPVLWPSETLMVETLNALAARADIILPGIAEGRILAGSSQPEAIARFYLDMGCKAVVVKLGPEGAYVATALQATYVPGVPVPSVVDTVGAGDGFAVGVISSLLEQETLPAAAARGNRIGARVVQFPGDSDGLPTRAELGLAPLPRS
ncbi:sugar kinase [Leeia oryzae]|uniref:sugar kinase n=1 Tax=Leeia oryzae TaxID=356662 RepID=UPI0003744C56|nr:sugar kinase [Leeia oryzae]